jgi:hypothetical protein
VRDVDERWRDRYGTDGLRDALAAVAAQVERRLPAHLPLNGHGDGRVAIHAEPARADAGTDDLAGLLARVLLAFTIDDERSTPLSLAHRNAVLRAVTADGVAARELPTATGVAKETLQVVVGTLERTGYVTVAGQGRGKAVRLTAAGADAQRAHDASVAATEAAWLDRFGGRVVTGLRRELEQLVRTTELGGSPLADAVNPPPGTWRAATRQHPERLPHHPVVSHRGGYPDGS